MDAVKESFLGSLTPFWLLLSPYLSAWLFSAFCLESILKRKRSREKGLSTMRIVLLILGCYTIFNAYDFFRYRETGLTISSINQGWYCLFFMPPDLYKPYVKIQLSASSNEYQTAYTHAYGGMQTLALGLVNNAPKAFEYGEPDEVNLVFSGVLHSADMGVVNGFDVAYTNYYLSAGTNYLPICRYEIESIRQLRKGYNMELKIDGDLSSFMKRYPGSFLLIKNGTRK